VAEIVHAETAGKLQDQINQLQTLLEDPSLRPTTRVAVAAQMTTATNSLQKHLHEIRQGTKRLERLQAGPASGPAGPREGGPDPARQQLLHDAVRSSRERTVRARQQAAEQPAREVLVIDIRASDVSDINLDEAVIVQSEQAAHLADLLHRLDTSGYLDELDDRRRSSLRAVARKLHVAGRAWRRKEADRLDYERLLSTLSEDVSGPDGAG
jgi:hypothetical protein